MKKKIYQAWKNFDLPIKGGFFKSTILLSIFFHVS